MSLPFTTPLFDADPVALRAPSRRSTRRLSTQSRSLALTCIVCFTGLVLASAQLGAQTWVPPAPLPVADMSKMA